MVNLKDLSYDELKGLLDAKKQQQQAIGFGTKDTWYIQMIQEELDIRKGDGESNVNYKKAYHLFMMFWDSLPEEDRLYIDKELKKIGL